MKPPPLLSVLVMSEDSGEQVGPALFAILKRMFQVVEPACGTHRLEFLPSDDESRNALRGKVHAGPKPAAYRHRLLLAGKIADQLAKANPDGFVAYHADADRRWSERTDNDFSDFTRLRDVVAERLRTPRRGGAGDPSLVDRLFLLGAYWELEAWLYQNLDVARALCREHDGGGHDALFDEWELDRALLDDVKDTKDACCLRDRHNQRLAEEAYPRDAAYAAGASLAASVDRMRTCAALVAALGRTTGGWGSSE